MSGSSRTNQRTATLSVLGILAVPILAVSSAALLAGPVSSVEPVHIGTAILATLLGAVVGLAALRVVSAAIGGVRTAAIAAATWFESDSFVSPPVHGSRFVVRLSTIPVTSHHVRSLPRRGPPSRL